MARKYHDAHLWPRSHDEELNQIDSQRAIKLLFYTDIQNRYKPIGLKYLLRIKTKADGQTAKHKAHWYLCGYRMIPGIYYEEKYRQPDFASKTKVL